MKKQLAVLLDQEMDRAQFLRYAGVGIMMLLGGNAIMQAISAFGDKHVSHGYGSSSYGGNDLRRR
jgi:hypothetical protein